MNLPAVILVTGTDMLSVRRIVERDSDLPTAFNQEVMESHVLPAVNE
ncbi:hypothetical protein GCM10009712_42060 [Pseudarthrobacter sulfonivorans]|nr:hypothetical protein [Pseudarthrobacter sulfonivorans]